MNSICRHIFDPTHYGRFKPNYAPIDGLGIEHRIIQRKCLKCDNWFQVCMIHMPKKVKLAATNI